MKKLYILALLLATGTALDAQISKGNIFIGGNIVLDNQNNTAKVGNESQPTVRVTNFTFTLNSGYFVADNWALGLNIGYGYGREVRPGLLEGNRTLIIDRPLNLNLFVRRYFMKQGIVGFFPEITGGYVTGTTKTELRTPDGTTITRGTLSGFSGRLGLGITWFPREGKPIAFEAVLGVINYSAVTTTMDQTSPQVSFKDNSLSFRSATFGMHYYFY
ncbi:MAG TPA: hypothetical protein VEC12_14765 [Bacteroidia bacterium]|nr:hypothetical protein [Bacteroidia bacterium]